MSPRSFTPTPGVCPPLKFVRFQFFAGEQPEDWFGRMAAEAVASVRQGGDLVAACSTLATRPMCRLIGIPDDDVSVFARWLDILSPVFLVMAPEQIAAATAAITELQSYVDELTTRRSKDPGHVYGTTIPVGSMVFLCIAAACRDASAWREPDHFDPDRFSRPDTPRLLNFGAGTHYCLGHALAKIAVEESVRAVLAADPPCD